MNTFDWKARMNFYSSCSTCYATNLQSIASQGFSSTVPTLEKLADLPSPRVLKSHLAAYLLPPDLLDTCKVSLGIKCFDINISNLVKVSIIRSFTSLETQRTLWYLSITFTIWSNSFSLQGQWNNLQNISFKTNVLTDPRKI